MKPDAFHSLPGRVLAGVALASLMAGAALAEGKLRVTNTSVNPVSISVDGKSRDIRPRKAATFPLPSSTATVSLMFANGMAHRGELDVSGELPITGVEDGLDYWCVLLREDGMDVEPKADCDKKVNKPKK